MTKRETILEAGKQIAAVASGRARKKDPKEILNDPTLEKQGAASSRADGPTPAENASRSDPGNPNDRDHTDQNPGQEKAGRD